jgi:hypothetical protein
MTDSMWDILFVVVWNSAGVVTFVLCFKGSQVIARKLLRQFTDLKEALPKSVNHRNLRSHNKHKSLGLPLNAEYLLYLFLRKEEREALIGDLAECYGEVIRRFGKVRADIWFYKQVAGSLFPLIRRAVLRVAALAWLGRALRRLIS